METREEIYGITEDFVKQQWTKFARTTLNLSDDSIEQLNQKYMGNFPEIKYQTARAWISQNGNSCEKLKNLKHKFFCKNWPEIVGSPSDETVHDEDWHSHAEGDLSKYALSKKKGCVLLISNSFSASRHLSSRQSAAKKDIENMTSLWSEKFGCKLFEEKAHMDQTAEQMNGLLERFSKIKDVDYIVLCISTHGGIVPEKWVQKFEPVAKLNENPDSSEVMVEFPIGDRSTDNQEEPIAEVMLGNDGRPIRLREIKKYFYNDAATGLQDIPKFFILGYCRGNITDQGILKGVQPAQSQAVPTYRRSFLETLMPTVSDILIVFSTHETYTSFEDPQQGTWLISTVQDVFRTHHRQKHVVDMLTLVNNAMKLKNAGIDKKIGKAMSIFESSLVKDFYLS